MEISYLVVDDVFRHMSSSGNLAALFTGTKLKPRLSFIIFISTELNEVIFVAFLATEYDEVLSGYQPGQMVER
jgi:hypothetical protein